MTSQWLPPSGSAPGPEAPRQAPPAPADRSSTRAIVLGVVSIVIGVAAIAVQNAYKLDAETILTGGAYLKDGFRTALLACGSMLAALGLVLTILGASSTAKRPLRRGIGVATIVVATVTLLAVLLAIAGVSKERNRSTGGTASDGPAVVQDDPGPGPGREASGDGSPVSCGSGGCFQDGETVYPIGDNDVCFIGGDPGHWRANDVTNEYVCVTP